MQKVSLNLFHSFMNEYPVWSFKEHDIDVFCGKYLGVVPEELSYYSLFFRYIKDNKVYVLYNYPLYNRFKNKFIIGNCYKISRYADNVFPQFDCDHFFNSNFDCQKLSNFYLGIEENGG